MIVPQRRGELEEFAPELRPIESDEDLRRKYEFLFLSPHVTRDGTSSGNDGRPPRESASRGKGTTRAR